MDNYDSYYLLRAYVWETGVNTFHRLSFFFFFCFYLFIYFLNFILFLNFTKLY